MASIGLELWKKHILDLSVIYGMLCKP